MRALQQEFIDILSAEARIQGKKLSSVKVKPYPINKLSAWDLAELMGTNRDT